MATLTGPLRLDAGSVKNEHVSNVAADAIDADKMQHCYNITENFGLEYNGTPAAKVFVLSQTAKAGVLRRFFAGLYDSGTSTSITFDLKKNGTTVLSSVVTVVHGDGDRCAIEGTLSVTTYVAGDVFTVHLATSATTGAQGPYATACFEDSAAP